MKRRIYPAIVLLCLLMISAKVRSQECLEVVKVTSRQYFTGMLSTSGVNYRIKVALKCCQEVKFDGFWVGNDYCRPKVMPRRNADTILHEGIDTILLSCYVFYFRFLSDTGAKYVYVSPPVPLKSKALLGVVMGESRRYIAIDNIEELPPLRH